MSEILDQRHMSGVKIHTDQDGVRLFWREHAEEMRIERGYMFVNRRNATDFRMSRQPVYPYVNHGRWVADCYCKGGIAIWRDHEQCCCLDCGTIYTKIEWPSAKDLKLAGRALAEMPIPEMRNWDPRQEKVETLDRRMKRQAMEDVNAQISERLGIPVGDVVEVLRELRDMPGVSIQGPSL